MAHKPESVAPPAARWQSPALHRQGAKLLLLHQAPELLADPCLVLDLLPVDFALGDRECPSEALECLLDIVRLG